MKLSDVQQRLTKTFAGVKGRVVGFAQPAWALLTHSLVEGIILPKKGIYASIGKGSLELVYGTMFLSQVRFHALKHVALNEERHLHPETVASALELAVHELKAKGAEIVLAVPREWVVTRMAELPSTVKETLSEVVRYELDRLTPFGATEAFYDFSIAEETNGRLKLFIAATRSETLDPYLQALRQKGLKVAAVTTKELSLNALGDFLQIPGEGFRVEVTDGEYEGFRVKRGYPASFFGGSVILQEGLSSLGAFAEKAGLLAEEPKGNGGTPEIIVYCRDGRASTGLEPMGLPVRTVTEKDVRIRFKTHHEETSFNSLGGLLQSLVGSLRKLNLLGKEENRGGRTPWTVTILLIVGILAAMIPYGLVPLKMEERRLQEIERQITLRRDDARKVEALKKEMEGLSAEIEEIKRFKESKPMALTVVKELTTILPKTVWLTRAHVSEETIDIEGYAQSATEILPRLEQSPLFKKVEFTSPTIKDSRMNSDRFLIRMELEGFEKKDTDKVKHEKKK
jgi:Tfp pilus assembly protein PilN